MKTSEEFFVLVCRRSDQADRAFNQLRRLERKNFVKFRNLVLLEKDRAGQTHFVETEELRPLQTAFFGGLLGGGLGWLEGLTFVGAGLAVGAVLGFLVATWQDRGLINHELQMLAGLLSPNSAVIIGQVKSHGVDMLWISLIDNLGLLVRSLTYDDLAGVIRKTHSFHPNGMEN